MGYLIGMVVQPGCTRLFESSLKDMTVATLDHAGTDRQAQLERSGIIQAVHPIGQVTMSITHWSFFFRRANGLQMLLQCFQHLLDGSSS